MYAVLKRVVLVYSVLDANAETKITIWETISWF